MAELDKGKLKGFAGKLFAQTEGEKGCLFELDGNKYKLQGGYDEITGGSLFDNEFDLDGVTTNTKIINFNEVKRIEPKSFESLKSESDQLEFYFESDEVIKLDPYAFGSDFSKLRAMKGNNKKVEIMLSSETFENHNVITNMEAIEDVDLYLHGEWTKEELKKIIEIIENGKIYQASGKNFELLDGKFTSEDLTEDQLNKLNNRFIRLIMEKETADSLVKDKKEKKQEEEKEFYSWNNLEKDHKNMIDFVLDTMAKNNLYIRLTVDANKAKIQGNSMAIDEECVTNVKLINGNISILDVLKMLSNTGVNGKKLKNNKENRDAAKGAVKEYIRKNIRQVALKIRIKYDIINGEKKGLKKGSQGNGIIGVRDGISNITEANECLSNVIKSLSIDKNMFMGGGNIIDEIMTRELIDSLKIIGEKHKKDKDKTLVKLCISCIRELKKGLKS